MAPSGMTAVAANDDESHHRPYDRGEAVCTYIPILREHDLARAREGLSELAMEIGFSTDATLMLRTAVSELARNILCHAGSGAILLTRLADGNGLRVVAVDRGPGMGGGAVNGVGLAAVHRLMDATSFESQPGGGTTVACTKWLNRGVSGRTAA